MNQTQPSGSPTAGGGGRSETHRAGRAPRERVSKPGPLQDPWTEPLQDPGQRPCPCAAGQPPSKTCERPAFPPRAAWTQPLPNTDWWVPSTRLQTKRRQLTSCSQDSNPAPVAGLCMFHVPTEGPMGPVSSQCPRTPGPPHEHRWGLSVGIWMPVRNTVARVGGAGFHDLTVWLGHTACLPGFRRSQQATVPALPSVWLRHSPAGTSLALMLAASRRSVCAQPSPGQPSGTLRLTSSWTAAEHLRG